MKAPIPWFRNIGGWGSEYSTSIKWSEFDESSDTERIAYISSLRRIPTWIRLSECWLEFGSIHLHYDRRKEEHSTSKLSSREGRQGRWKRRISSSVREPWMRVNSSEILLFIGGYRMARARMTCLDLFPPKFWVRWEPSDTFDGNSFVKMRLASFASIWKIKQVLTQIDRPTSNLRLERIDVV